MLVTTFFSSGGMPAVDLSPTIRIRDVPSTVLVVNAFMTGVGDGWYSYDFGGYIGSSSYAIRCDGGPNLSGSERFTWAGNENFVEDVWGANETLHNSVNTMGSLLHSASAPVATVASVASGVWSQVASAFNVTGTMGHLLNTSAFISGAVQFIADVHNGTWLITGSQMVLYSSGSLLHELARFNLQDITGTLITSESQPAFRKVRV